MMTCCWTWPHEWERVRATNQMCQNLQFCVTVWTNNWHCNSSKQGNFPDLNPLYIETRSSVTSLANIQTRCFSRDWGNCVWCSHWCKSLCKPFMVLKLDQFDYCSLHVDCLACLLQITVILAHLICDLVSLSLMLPSPATCRHCKCGTNTSTLHWYITWYKQSTK